MDGTWYFQLLREGTDISDFRSTILFGQHDLGDAGHGDETRVAALSDDAEICGCNGVTKGQIVDAIQTQGLFTLNEVRAHTKASASCGSCTGLVEAILSSTVGEGYEAQPSKKPLCGCTEHSHDEVIKAMRTVKTCAGKKWCRFGTQDSTGLGVKLEELTWGSWMPHKFKLAVSGCPRNCAEATIKDFGVVCVDSGYELHIGGNGGIKVRVTDLLCKVDTEEEALEYCGAFTQMYREEAHYLERTAPWVERVGLSYIRSRILEDEAGRKALYERFKLGQKYAQIDPWKERAEGKDAHEFRPLKLSA